MKSKKRHTKQKLRKSQKNRKTRKSRITQKIRMNSSSSLRKKKIIGGSNLLDLVEEAKEFYKDEFDIFYILKNYPNKVSYESMQKFENVYKNKLNSNNLQDLKYSILFVNYFASTFYRYKIFYNLQNTIFYDENAKKELAKIINENLHFRNPSSDTDIVKIIELNFNGYEQYLSDDVYPYVISKKIENKSIEYTDEIKQRIAKIYTKTPKYILFNYPNLSGFEKFLNKNCFNLSVINGELEVFIDENGKQWCFSPEEWKEIQQTHVNPYTQHCIENACVYRPFREKDFETTTEYVELSDNSFKQLYLFTMDAKYIHGLIFVKFDKTAMLEYAKTLVKNKKYRLYRGISFDDKETLDKVIEKINNNDLKFHTYSSWSYSNLEAAKFAEKKKYGAILTAEFTCHELLIDLTRVKNKLLYNEEECIALPIRDRSSERAIELAFYDNTPLDLGW